MREWLKEMKEEKWWLVLLWFVLWFIEPLRLYSYLLVTGSLIYWLFTLFHPRFKAQTLENNAKENDKKINRYFENILQGKHSAGWQKEKAEKIIKSYYEITGLYGQLKAKNRHSQNKILLHLSQDLSDYTEYVEYRMSDLMWLPEPNEDENEDYRRGDLASKAREIEKNWKEMLKKD